MPPSVRRIPSVRMVVASPAWSAPRVCQAGKIELNQPGIWLIEKSVEKMRWTPAKVMT